MNHNVNPEAPNPTPNPHSVPQNPSAYNAGQSAQPPQQPTPPYSYGTYQQYQQPNQGQYQQPDYSQPQGQQNYYSQNQYVDESGLFSENKMTRLNGTSANVKLSDWMKADCLQFLNYLLFPIGSIAYLVIYFILAFSSKTNKSMKTRYQANLIWAAIGLGLVLLLFLFIFVVLGVSLGELASEVSPY